MSENNKSDNDHPEAGKKNNRASQSVLWRIVFVGGIFLMALLFTSIVHPNMSERVKFVTVNALSVFVVVAIVVQAHIYRRQWEVMKVQADSMKDGLEETRNLVSQNQRAVKAAEHSVDVAQQNMFYSQRAYVGIRAGEVVDAYNDAGFRLKIKNFGNTWANEVRIASIVTVHESRRNPAVDPASVKWSVFGTIAPHSDVRLFQMVQGITPEQRRLIEAGTLRLYCCGIIQYKDIFGQPQSTRFALAHRSGTKEFGPCDTGNEAT